MSAKRWPEQSREGGKDRTDVRAGQGSREQKGQRVKGAKGAMEDKEDQVLWWGGYHYDQVQGKVEGMGETERDPGRADAVAESWLDL